MIKKFIITFLLRGIVMKKGLLFALMSLVFSPCVQADNNMEELEGASSRMIEYTVTIYCDEKCNKKEWDKMQADAVRAIKRGNGSESGDVVDAIIESLGRMNTKEQGVHGMVGIAMSDGNCPTGRCNVECACKEDYRGLCPCGLATNRGGCKNMKNEENSSGCCKMSDCSKEACDEGCQRSCAMDKEKETSTK